MARKATYEQLEKRVEELEGRLVEREKELNCLYWFSRLIEKTGASLGERLQELPAVLAASWQHPEIASARVVLGELEFATPDFRVTRWRQTAPILAGDDKVGKVEICYLEQRPERDEGPFLKEERVLMDAIAKRLGRIWEREQLAEEIKVQWEQFVSIMDGFAHSLYVSDPRTYEVLLVNKSLAKEMGKNPVGGLCYQEFQGRTTPCDFCTNDIILKERKPYVWERYNPLLGKDFLLTDQIIHWPDGREVRFQYAVDITERRRMEKDLRETKTFLEMTLESLADAVFVVDPADRTVVSCNPALEKIFGYREEELIGKNTECLHVNRKTYEEFGKKLFATLEEKGVFHTEYQMRRKDGSLFYTENTVTEIVDETGHRSGVVSVVRDITPRVQAEEERDELQSQLLQAQKMESLGILAGGIAHDFNNILMPVTLNTELALRNVEEESKIFGYLSDVLEAAKHGKELVKQITTFSRRREQKRSPVKITPVIKEAVKLLAASLPSTIEVCEDIDGCSGLEVMADPTQIHQVLINLCTNSAHAMRKKGGTLEVSLGGVDIDQNTALSHLELEPGPYLRLTVRDTGEGMSPEARERIFEPFFTTRERSGGTGMGLAVVHGIVKSHGGAITVHSEEGQGAVFHVFFPRIPSGSVEQSPPLTDARGGSERILLIDDEETTLRSERNALVSLGYQVVSTPEGGRALKVFQERPDRFDVVIVDQTMPEMTGLDLSRKLLDIRKDLPIILCTGFSETVDEDKARAEGVREFVMKPFTTREMAEAIRRVLDG